MRRIWISWAYLYICNLVNQEMEELRVRLEREDTAATVRSPYNLELLSKLADAVSSAELEKYWRI